jgi:hypothetical protein
MELKGKILDKEWSLTGDHYYYQIFYKKPTQVIHSKSIIIY